MAYVIEHYVSTKKRWENAIGEDAAAFPTLDAAAKKLRSIKKEIDRDVRRSGVSSTQRFRIIDAREG